MNMDFWELFLFAFLGVAVVYAGLACSTSILYRRRSWGRLTRNELRVKQGTATLEIRLEVFIWTLVCCLFTYQIYLLAFFLSGFAYLLLKYVPS